jgi:putative transposase
MANSLTSILIHIVFSTKSRERVLLDHVRPVLSEYLGGITKQQGSQPIIFNSTLDHIHGLVALGNDKSIAHLIRHLKKGSNLFLQEKFPVEFKNRFSWQSGYGAFSVSYSAMPEVITYIKNQEKHHERLLFEEEFCNLIKKHQIECDDQYLLG